jgi:hypothetical protein
MPAKAKCIQLVGLDDKFAQQMVQPQVAGDATRSLLSTQGTAAALLQDGVAAS